MKIDMKWLEKAINAVIDSEDHVMLSKDKGKIKVYNVGDNIIRVDIKKEK